MLGPRLFAITLLLAPGRVAAQAPSDASRSRSVGRPHAGRLLDGVPLPDGPRLAVKNDHARYGTSELVALIRASVDAVHAARPGTPRLVVGDLSRRRGGAFSPHSSHRAGRDIDIGFFYVDPSGAPYPAEDFIRVRGDGRCALEGEPCALDVARTWDLMAAMLGDEAQVQYVMLASHLRDLLLDEAERRGAPMELIARFRLVTAPITGSQSHRDHFHVRVYCALDDRPRCVDEGPMHPWARFGEHDDPLFVSQATERGRERYAAELAAEVRDRVRRRAVRERREAIARSEAAAAERDRLHRDRVRARRTRQEASAREAEERARADRRAHTLARRAAAEEAQREREAFRRLSPDERRAVLRQREAEERAEEEARRARVREAMTRRAEERAARVEAHRREVRARIRARLSEEGARGRSEEGARGG
ncbi:MAG: penicillin-insensitive murein endopeptidase [Sandaracinaceae bacterium]